MQIDIDMNIDVDVGTKIGRQMNKIWQIIIFKHP